MQEAAAPVRDSLNIHTQDRADIASLFEQNTQILDLQQVWKTDNSVCYVATLQQEGSVTPVQRFIKKISLQGDLSHRMTSAQVRSAESIELEKEVLEQFAQVKDGGTSPDKFVGFLSSTENQAGDALYQVFEFMPEGNMVEAMATPPTYDQLLTFNKDVGEALTLLHEVGIAHGDLDPSSVLRAGERYKLGDFTGVCDISALPSSGKIEFAAPECNADNRISPPADENPGEAADLYSYAQVIYQWMFGIPSYYADVTSQDAEVIARGQLVTSIRREHVVEDKQHAFMRMRSLGTNISAIDHFDTDELSRKAETSMSEAEKNKWDRAIQLLIDLNTLFLNTLGKANERGRFTDFQNDLQRILVTADKVAFDSLMSYLKTRPNVL